MDINVETEIEALREMTVKQLRQRHVDLFGEPIFSGHREFLFRRLAWRVQAMAEGGLSERARQRASELAREEDVRIRAPQGFTAALPKPGERRVVTGKVGKGRDEREPCPGTVLKREFKGHVHEVVVASNGYEYDGRLYRSLSAVAKAITGSHWNGYLFFGLKGNGKSK